MSALNNTGTSYICPKCQIERIVSSVHTKIKDFIAEIHYNKGISETCHIRRDSRPTGISPHKAATCKTSVKTNSTLPRSCITSSVPPIEGPISGGACNSDHIVIIDNIKDPSKYRTRKQILREINRVKPALNIKYVYSLAAGGICLHLHSAVDLDLALTKWPTDTFGTSEVIPHLPAPKEEWTKVYITRVPVNVTTDSINKVINCDCSAQRLKLSGTNTVSKTVAIKVRRTEAHKVIEEGVSLQGTTYKCTPQRAIKIVRCYKCQHFGHIAKTCVDRQSCANCGEEHDSMVCTAKSYKCANCGGSHSAYSSHCSTYQQITRKLHSIY